MFKIVLLLSLLLFSHVNAYESEDKIKAVIIGKVSKYISWKDNTENDFIITLLKDPFNGLLEKTYKNKKIKSKNVKIVHIDSIEDLEFTHILYIPNSQASKLPEILEKTKNKNILTVSDIRGFAEKKGVMQVYFASQKIKLKINLDTAKENDLHIRSSLLNIATVIREND